MKKRACSFLLFLLLTRSTDAAIVLPPVLSDHMVLQQKARIRIWGTATPHEKITVHLLRQAITTQADPAGKWVAWLAPVTAKQPVVMTVTGTADTVTVQDILIGDVWLASGQSNMEWKVNQSNQAAEEISQANYPQIRFFRVRKGNADTVAAFVQGTWEICSPATAGNFSAVAYFFGRDLYRHKPMPLGFIEANWGGTNAQAWTPLKAIEEDPVSQYILDNWKKVLADYPAAFEKYQLALEKWKKEAAIKKAGDSVGAAPRPPAGAGTKEAPGSIYNVMIAPLAGYTLRGVIWYQGEANAYQSVAYPYRYLFATLINAWRKAWGQGDFPFLFVQLSSLSRHPYWPVLRESQAEALQLKNTGMAVSLDVGDSTDAHYKNKQVIGYRLHLVARHLVDGENIVWSGPVYKKMAIENNTIRLWFKYATGLKASQGSSLTGFTIAGEDGRFIPATATIEGETIVLVNAAINKPVAVRYSFVDWPPGNLVNAAGLPAASFRTDHFQIK